MSKKRTSVLLLFAAVGVLAWAFTALFAAALVLTALGVYAAGVALLLVASTLVWLTLPGARRQYYRSHKWRIVLVTVASIGFTGAVGFVANRKFLPGALDSVSLVADAVIVLFAFLAAWTFLADRRRPSIVVAAAVLFVAALSVLVSIGSRTRASRDDRVMQNLAALPYLTWTSHEGAGGEDGVMYHNEEEAYDGINIYNPRNLSKTHLMDMSGKILHTWSADIHGGDSWVLTEMLPNGDLLAIVDERTLVKLDWDSNVIWTKDIRIHHDMAVGDGGELVLITKRQRRFRVRGMPVVASDDQLTFLSASREIVKQISLAELVGDRIVVAQYLKQYLWIANPLHLRVALSAARKNTYEVFDLFHANTVEIIDRDIDDVFRQGNVLFCVRNLSLLGVVDPVTEELMWTWGPGELDWPHHATLLDNGHILVFDNGTHRGFSRVVEMDPATSEIVWEYQADPPPEFFSVSRGGNQRLPNGNTLITDSDKGRAIEVTKDGKIVWEFYNPERGNGKARSVIYRLMRLTDYEAYPCLQRIQE